LQAELTASRVRQQIWKDQNRSLESKTLPVKELANSEKPDQDLLEELLES
jgi:hypothetical protein